MKKDTTFPDLKDDEFFCGGIVYPKMQYKEVLEAWFGQEPLPKPKFESVRK